MNLLFTGLNGLLGSSLRENNYDSCTFFSLQRNLSKFKKKNIVEIKCDLKNFSEEIIPKNIDAIIHLAQSRHYKNFPEMAEDIFEVNVNATFKLLNYAKKNKIKYFLFASTGDVIFENTNKAYRTFYSTNKYISEKIISHYNEYINIAVIRLFGLYHKNQSRGLIYNLKKKILNDEYIFLNGKENGDLVHITHTDDCAALINYFVKKKITGIYDVAPSRRVSIQKISEIIAKKFNKKLKIKRNKKIMPKITSPDTKELKRIYDLKNLRSPIVGLKDAIN